MSVNKETIARIRTQFLETVVKTSDGDCDDGCYHSADLDRIRSDDWTVERYLLTTKSEDEAVKAIQRTMRWRKSFGLNDFRDQRFPSEMWSTGLVVRYCRDRADRPVVYVQNSRYRKCGPDWLQRFKEFIVWQYESADREAGAAGWGLINDANGAGLANVDIELSRFMIDVLKHYYPGGPRYLLAVDLPWILKATAQLIVSFMNDSLRSIYRAIKSADLREYLSPEWIPIHLGGLYSGPPLGSVIPDNVLQMTDQSMSGQFTDDQIRKFYAVYKSELK
ncbi:motile sperm domain-containing protein 2-like [Oppia nitens]|uniref:motile sperm domain-containing protein 2-like n=1 Tax=Oppia nitens TaxID=1686743 RepID=UPI0023DB7360|nr:motile sperm domain-containing protein 2-like [Oppia nitens]